MPYDRHERNGTTLTAIPAVKLDNNDYPPCVELVPPVPARELAEDSLSTARRRGQCSQRHGHGTWRFRTALPPRRCAWEPMPGAHALVDNFSSMD